MGFIAAVSRDASLTSASAEQSSAALWLAEDAARELPNLSLEDALRSSTCRWRLKRPLRVSDFATRTAE